MSPAEGPLTMLCGVAALLSPHSCNLRISCIRIVGERSLLNLRTMHETVTAVD